MDHEQGQQAGSTDFSPKLFLLLLGAPAPVLCPSHIVYRLYQIVFKNSEQIAFSEPLRRWNTTCQKCNRKRTFPRQSTSLPTD
jgi:hypothetical protein